MARVIFDDFCLLCQSTMSDDMTDVTRGPVGTAAAGHPQGAAAHVIGLRVAVAVGGRSRSGPDPVPRLRLWQAELGVSTPRLGHWGSSFFHARSLCSSNNHIHRSTFVSQPGYVLNCLTAGMPRSSAPCGPQLSHVKAQVSYHANLAHPSRVRPALRDYLVSTAPPGLFGLLTELPPDRGLCNSVPVLSVQWL